MEAAVANTNQSEIYKAYDFVLTVFLWMDSGFICV